MRLMNCLNIADLRARARRRLPRPIFDYMDGGAETEATMQRNSAAFDELRLIPHCLVDVARIDMTTTILGRPAALPLLCSPTGASRFYHPDGELAIARAAGKADIPYFLSTMATNSLEAVAAASTGPKVFQLYVMKDRGITDQLIDRARAAGYDALCLTVDAVARGKRERELRSGMGVPLRLTLTSMAQFAICPGWLAGQARRGPMSMANIAMMSGDRHMAGQTRFIGGQLDASVTWKDIDRFAQRWGGPIAIKGIMAADDAQRAVDAGAGAVILSNHGGRQLDGAAAPFDVLPEVARAIGGAAEIIVDGGVRRGVHILKALALGATACAIGRPYLYGLAAGGESGVDRAIEILADELAMAMRLTGCASVGEARAIPFMRAPTA